MRKLLDMLFHQPDPSADWISTRMRAVTQTYQIGPRYQTGQFTKYLEVVNE